MDFEPSSTDGDEADYDVGDDGGSASVDVVGGDVHDGDGIADGDTMVMVIMMMMVVLIVMSMVTTTLTLTPNL